MNTAIDYSNTTHYWPQFDSDRPVTPLEALKDGDEGAATAFADWMADDEQRDELHDLLSYLGENDVVKKLAEKWAREAA
ncbi:hypothetical protein [Halomonas sp. IOP_31]|uniref:hypothetical protein n=1 Tax=Halomonas sp. IOP_31 TaxID=2876584 RepID=UPI001E570007|nr:hypothetical protein [Halomonas sp. IOP_31]MCD6006865.1 hypothetical protein [Halomonas sp. IOP_31]